MVGIFGNQDVSKLVYLCLYALQHRGQEGSGIAVTDGERFSSHKSAGLVADVFTEQVMANLHGHIAIGTNKYSTAKDRHNRNLQPLVATLSFGKIAIAGNVTLLSDAKKRELVNQGAIFTTDSDSEVILHMVAQKSTKKSVEQSILETFSELKGAYTAIFLLKDKIIAVRDPHGFKSLILGKKDDIYMVVAETAALDLLGADFVREVEPGEVLIIDTNGVNTYANIPKGALSPCIFEHVYTARPDSLMFGRSVYEVRKKCGAFLAKQSPCDADIVVAVPDSGLSAAIGYSHESGIPMELGIIRNHYVGRTFIRPTQEIRNFGVKVKLNPIGKIIKGKKIVVIDDSIVRGTTSRQIVHMLKEAGAAEVHMRIASPPVVFPCIYGIDTPTKEELLLNRMTLEESIEYIGVDSLEFVTVENMLKAVENTGYCMACFTGNYLLK